MTLTKSQQLAQASNEPIETSEYVELNFTADQDSYALPKKASSLTKVVAYQVLTTDSEATNIAGGNSWFLPDAQGNIIVVKLKDAPNTVFDGYEPTFVTKTVYSDSEPTGLGITVTLSWQKYLRDTNGDLVLDIEGHPILTGTRPTNGDQIVIDFHGHDKVKDAKLTAGRTGFTLPVGHRVEAGVMQVTYNSATQRLMNSSQTVPDES